MRNWRVVTAIAAVVLAVLAGVLVWQYVDEADERAEEEQAPEEVLVAAADIARGTETSPTADSASEDSDDDGDDDDTSSVNEALFETVEFPADDVQPDWLRPDDLETLEGLVASADIPKGLPIVLDQFVERGTIDGFDGIVADGKQAITISVDESHGVAGFVLPGDSVNVLLTLEVGDLASQSEDATVTAFLVPGLKVLAVGQTTEFGNESTPTYSTDTNGDGEVNTEDDPDETPAETVRRGLLTLEVNPRQAEQIAHANVAGTMYLSLNPDGFDAATFQNPEEIVEAINLFDQDLPRVREALELLAQAQQQG